MALTQDQIAQQMIAQLRVIDPSVSAEIGTPERKVIDTVAQQIASTQVDVNLLQGAGDISTKYGSDLDSYLGNFGFGRQAGPLATGVVTFGRSGPSAYDITIPLATQLSATTTDPQGNSSAAVFQTTAAVTLAAGQTSVGAPIQALLSGSTGNVGANTITAFADLGSPPIGITTVTNTLATSGGDDAESDSAMKVRFNNTVFRNVAGTSAQYMALAVSTQYSTKANVLGPISRFTEYLQVPLVDDSQSEAATATISASGTNLMTTLTGVALVSGGVPLIGNVITGTGIPANTTIIDIETVADATTYTLSNAYTGSTGVISPNPTVATGEPADGGGNGLPGQFTTVYSGNPYAKYIYAAVPYFLTNGGAGASTIFYRQGVDFVLNSPPIDAGDTYRAVINDSYPLPSATPDTPNVTLLNVYLGGDTSVQLPTPGAIVQLEYSYLSAESRNDVARNITNCVDVYVNGQNPTSATSVVPVPSLTTLISTTFNLSPISSAYVGNFIRTGMPETQPTVGNIFMGLFWSPLISIPQTITGGDTVYALGTDYFQVTDVSPLGNTVRARDGIEWVAGTVFTVDTLTIDGYVYDRNITDLQTSLEAAKQITTDVLAHAATTRYFKLDLTVVYTAGIGIAVTNVGINAAIATFLNGQYFGTIIQLTDLLMIARSAPGVQNVRWTHDVIAGVNRVTETDVTGTPIGTVYNADFALLDSQLPALPPAALVTDSVPGLILRPRSENTFSLL